MYPEAMAWWAPMGARPSESAYASGCLCWLAWNSNSLFLPKAPTIIPRKTPARDVASQLQSVQFSYKEYSIPVRASSGFTAERCCLFEPNKPRYHLCVFSMCLLMSTLCPDFWVLPPYFPPLNTSWFSGLWKLEEKEVILIWADFPPSKRNL